MFVEPTMPITCVGCGYCCFEKTCTFGKLRYPKEMDGRCPELKWNGKRYRCGMMDLPRTGYYYRMELRAGAGCVTSLNPWRDDVRERTDEEISELRSGL
jgi:hypothetical protein